MIRFLAILLLSCVTLRAAAPVWYCKTTNDLIAIEIKAINSRNIAILSGLSTTNSDAKILLYNTNSTAAVDWINVFKPSNQNGRWEVINVFDVAAGFRISGAAGINRFLKGNGTDFVSADLFNTVNDWTEEQDFELAASNTPMFRSQANGDPNYRFSVLANGQMNWGTGSAAFDTSLDRPAVGSLRVITNLYVTGLTSGRLVDASTSGLLISVPAPAVDGYVLSSTIAGVKSWIANGSGGVSGGNPTASVGLSVVNGSASTFLRSDGAPALSQSINPTWTGVHTHDSATILLRPTSVGDNTVTSRADGDVDDRFQLWGNGVHYWGDGTAAVDVNLYRNSAGVLRVNSILTADTGFRVNNAATSGNYLRGNGTDFVSSTIQAGDLPAGAKPKIYSITAESGVTNSTTITSFLVTGAGSKTIVGDTFAAGDQVRIRLGGFYATKNVTPGTFTISFNFGVAATDAIILSGFPAAVSAQLGTWWAEYSYSVNSLGVTGKIMGQGSFTYTNPLVTDVILGGGAKKSATTVDTTIDNLIEVSGTWQNADNANGIACTWATIELLK